MALWQDTGKPGERLRLGRCWSMPSRSAGAVRISGSHQRSTKLRRPRGPDSAASDISMQDALDLLHKFRTESTKVLAVFLRYSPSSGAKVPMAVVVGVVWEGAEGLFAVSTRSDFKGSFLGFHPKLASSFKYGDDRIVGNLLPTWPSPYSCRFAMTTNVSLRFSNILRLIASARKPEIWLDQFPALSAINSTFLSGTTVLLPTSEPVQTVYASIGAPQYFLDAFESPLE